MERQVTVIPAIGSRRTRGRNKANPNKKTRVAAYCRVSTEQEEQLNSFENQVHYYTKYIEERPDYQMVDIYTDEGISGTNTKKREGFNRMIADCEAGKIDLVITKSISRFARNTQDCLHYSRKLKALGIGIIFEKENISTLDASGELLFTILSSLAQEESRNISENSTWGIRHNFQRGILRINPTTFMGYDMDENKKLVIDPEQAKIVKRIFREFEEGWTYNEIAKHLNDEKIKGVRGKVAWNGATILGMLTNEKYMGDAILQKTFTTDFLTKKRAKNEGQVEQYYVKNSHKAIIPKAEWEAVQMELERRKDYCKEIGIKRYGFASLDNPFISKLVCGHCGAVVNKKSWSNRRQHVWACKNKEQRYGGTCHSENVKEETVRRAMVIAWNAVVNDRDKLIGAWETMRKEGDSLQALRARQMMELTAHGPIKWEIPELTRLVMERIVVHDKRHFTVRFLDGTVKEIVVTE